MTIPTMMQIDPLREVADRCTGEAAMLMDKELQRNPLVNHRKIKIKSKNLKAELVDFTWPRSTLG
jgi:hypothetical protein